MIQEKSPATLLHPAPAAPGQLEQPQDSDHWDYTKNAADVAELRQQFERQHGRQVRHTIGRDSRLAGGVYEGRYGGEAIVVDVEKDSELIDQAADAVIAGATDHKSGKIDKSRILDGVFRTVSTTMRYDSAAVDGIFQQQLGGKDGAKISLSYYIQAGVGECRHQALFAGAVLEKLRDQGVVSGMASVDRNMVRRGADGKYDGHAWVRYTNSANEVYILDVAQQKIGTLDDLMVAHERNPAETWDYARPEDKQRAAGHMTLGAIGIERPYDPASYTNEFGVIDRLPWDN